MCLQLYKAIKSINGDCLLLFNLWALFYKTIGIAVKKAININNTTKNKG